MEHVSHLRHYAKAFGARALDLLFPPQCLGCEALVERHGALCQPCWQGISFIADPMCARCGFPFEYGLGAEALCAECLAMPPDFAQARAVFRYDEKSHRLILPMKFYDQTYMAPTYGAWLARAAGPFLERSERIVPVPLHRRRLMQRKYNQAALLGQALAKIAHIPCVADGLRRIRHIPPQTGQTRAQRLENVRGAFAFNPKRKEMLAGRTVLLVDDVMTTGATLNACARALYKAGAAEVNVLTLARTFRAQ